MHADVEADADADADDDDDDCMGWDGVCDDDVVPKRRDAQTHKKQVLANHDFAAFDASTPAAARMQVCFFSELPELVFWK